MKALTIWQPWATLIAIGAKRFETRSWKPNYLGPLAIHASARTRESRELWHQEPFASVLAKAGITDIEKLPFGAVVCVARLTALHPAAALAPRLSDQERAFGDFRRGRWAWELTVTQPFREPIPARGLQLLWDWTPPSQASRGGAA